MLDATAKTLRRDIDTPGVTASNEMGKPVEQAGVELERAAASRSGKLKMLTIFFAVRRPVSEITYVSFLPLGTILAVMPWNLPYWQLLRGAGPIHQAATPASLSNRRPANLSGFTPRVRQSCPPVSELNTMETGTRAPRRRRMRRSRRRACRWHSSSLARWGQR